jgi:hypothetical protein
MKTESHVLDRLSCSYFLFLINRFYSEFIGRYFSSSGFDSDSGSDHILRDLNGSSIASSQVKHIFNIAPYIMLNFNAVTLYVEPTLCPSNMVSMRLKCNMHCTIGSCSGCNNKRAAH